MSVVKTYFMHCDGCGYDDVNTEGSSAAGARREASTLGWTHPRANGRSQMRIDLCQSCSDEAS